MSDYYKKLLTVERQALVMALIRNLDTDEIQRILDDYHAYILENMPIAPPPPGQTREDGSRASEAQGDTEVPEGQLYLDAAYVSPASPEVSEPKPWDSNYPQGYLGRVRCPNCETRMHNTPSQRKRTCTECDYSETY